MYLIRGKLAGREIPESLPASLIPPANLPVLNQNGDAPAVAQVSPAPGPPLPPRSNSQSSALQAVGEETVSEQRAATPPPPYEEPDVTRIASS